MNEDGERRARGTASDAKGAGSRRLGRSPLFLILLTVFVDFIGFGVIVPLLPFYNRAFGGGALILGLLIASFFLMQFLFAPALGRLSDRFGRRPVILGTLTASIAGHLILAFANSLVFLFAARLLAGFAAGNLSVARAYVADRTRPEERARGMGFIGAAFGVGFAFGPVIGGIFVPFGMSAPPLAAAALAATNLALAALALPESLTRELRTVRGSPRRAGVGEALRSSSIRPLVLTFLVVSFAFSTVPVAFPSLGIDYFRLVELQLAAIFVLIGTVQVVIGATVGRLAKWAGEERLVAVGILAMASAMALTRGFRDPRRVVRVGRRALDAAPVEPRVEANARARAGKPAGRCAGDRQPRRCPRPSYRGPPVRAGDACRTVRCFRGAHGSRVPDDDPRVPGEPDAIAGGPTHIRIRSLVRISEA